MVCRSLLLLAAGLVGACAPPAPPTPDPLAQQLCATLHTLPAQRREACCGSQAADLAQVCTREVDAALRRGALRLQPAAIDRCAAELATELAGCDWVTPLAAPLPPSCAALVEGTLAAGVACASSQECGDGLYCRGAGPGVSGVCAAPAAAGARCEVPADNLAAYLRADADPRHAACDGACVRGRCLARVAEGEACASSALCAAGLACLDGACSAAPLPALGAACSAQRPCAGRAVCVDGYCATPKAEGEACTLPFECRSLACLSAPGSAHGTCSNACAAGARAGFSPRPSGHGPG
jgi:hypothetical protein